MGSLDTSSLPAVADSAWDTVKDGYKAAKEGLGIATDAVGNTAKDAIDTTKAVINGDIELPEGSDVRANFFETFKDVLTEADIAIIKADPENKIRAKMIQERIIPRLMSIQSTAQLHALRTKFQTHRELNGLIELYGFAPMETGVPIPKSQINTSQMLREAKLAGKEAWSDMIKSTRTSLNLNSEMDDIAVGRYIVGLRARALMDTMRSVYGNPAFSQNGEHLTNKGWMLDTDGDWIEKWKGNDLAEALASSKPDRLDNIATLAKSYGRTNLFNEHVLSLVRAAADPSARSVTTNGVVQTFPLDESAKLEQIADELEAMRVGVASVDPMLYQEVLKGIQGAYDTGKDVLFNVFGMPVTLAKTVLTSYPAFLIATYIGVALNGGKWLYGSGLLKGLSGAILIQGKAIDITVKGFRGERNHGTPEEKQAAIDAAKKAQENVKKYADAKLEELREQERAARTAGNKDLSKRLNSRIDELGKFMRNYDANIAKGKILKYYTEVDMISRIDDISNGKGHRLSKTLGALKRGEFKVAGTRAWGAVKGAFGVTPDDLGAKMDDFDEKLKGTKADLKTVTVDVIQADGTAKKTTISYELLNKTAHSTLYESLVQDLERFEKYRKWKAYYDQYERAMKSLEEAKYDLKYVTEAMKGTAGVPSGGTARHVSVDAAGQARALENIAKAQEKVDLLSGKMAELKTTFNLTDLKITVDSVTGEVILDNTKIMKKYDPLVLSGRGSMQAQIQAKILRLGITPGTIDVTLKSAEEAKMAVLENIAKKAKVPKV